jgi:hypothetical protein
MAGERGLASGAAWDDTLSAAATVTPVAGAAAAGLAGTEASAATAGPTPGTVRREEMMVNTAPDDSPPAAITVMLTKPFLVIKLAGTTAVSPVSLV